MTTGSVSELHAFAQQCGVQRHLYHATPIPHYDVHESLYAAVQAAGVERHTTRSMLARLKGSDQQRHNATDTKRS